MDKKHVLVGIRMPRANQQVEPVQRFVSEFFPECQNISFSYAGADLNGVQGAFYTFVTGYRDTSEVDRLTAELAERISKYGAELVSSTGLRAILKAHKAREKSYIRSTRSHKENQVLDELKSCTESHSSLSAKQSCFVLAMLKATAEGRELDISDLHDVPFSRIGSVVDSFRPDEISTLLAHQNQVARQVGASSLN